MNTNSFKSVFSSDPITEYVAQHSLRLTEAQKGLSEVTAKHPEGGMMGAPESLQLNSNLMKLIKAKKVLDVGAFTGLSALAAALAIPEDGHVYTLDITDEYFKIGRPFLKEAGVESKINLLLGKALDTLDNLIAEGQSGTFDFAFIDADKVKIRDLYEKCLTLIRPGGIITLDNTIWGGRVVEESNQSVDTVAIREFNTFVKDDDRIDLSFLQTGDGLTLCFKK